MDSQKLTTASHLIPAWVDGNLIGVDKLLVHQQGLKHKAVSVFLMCGNQTLIQKRAADKYHSPCLWANACCTHPMLEEPALACAIRRLDQELGISGVTLSPMTQIEYRAEVGNGMIEHEQVEVFTGDVGADLQIEPNPDEVMDVQWIDIDDLKTDAVKSPDAYTEWLKIYLREFAL